MTSTCPHCGAPAAEGVAVCGACNQPIANAPAAPPASVTPPGWAPAAQGAPPMARPTGVTILGVLYFVAAGFAVLAGIAFFMGGALMGAAIGSTGDAAEAGAGFGALIGGFVGFFFLIGALISGVMGWGFWTGAAWAWVVALVLQGLGIVSGLLNLVQGEFSAVFGLALGGFIVWYLMQPGVKRWFGRPA